MLMGSYVGGSNELQLLLGGHSIFVSAFECLLSAFLVAGFDGDNWQCIGYMYTTDRYCKRSDITL